VLPARAQFTSLLQRGMLADAVCYYSAPDRRLTFVVQLGRRGRLSPALVRRAPPGAPRPAEPAAA